jgi:hypothetical protein
MNLRHISIEACPTCHAPAVQDRIESDLAGKIRQHCMGGQWERRTFSCGAEVSYVPNFQRIEHTGQCRNDPAYLEKIQKRRRLMQALLEVVGLFDVDEDFRNDLRRDLWRRP